MGYLSDRPCWWYYSYCAWAGYVNNTTPYPNHLAPKCSLLRGEEGYLVSRNHVVRDGYRSFAVRYHRYPTNARARNEGAIHISSRVPFIPRYERNYFVCAKSCLEIMHLISHMLVVDPAKRCTASQVPKHPWMLKSEKEFPDLTHFEVPLQANMYPKLLSFCSLLRNRTKLYMSVLLRTWGLAEYLSFTNPVLYRVCRSPVSI